MPFDGTSLLRGSRADRFIVDDVMDARLVQGRPRWPFSLPSQRMYEVEDRHITATATIEPPQPPRQHTTLTESVVMDLYRTMEQQRRMHEEHMMEQRYREMVRDMRHSRINYDWLSPYGLESVADRVSPVGPVSSETAFKLLALAYYIDQPDNIVKMISIAEGRCPSEVVDAEILAKVHCAAGWCGRMNHAALRKWNHPSGEVGFSKEFLGLSGAQAHALFWPHGFATGMDPRVQKAKLLQVLRGQRTFDRNWLMAA